MVDVVLVELEGVLFDTRELRRAALADALGAHGLDASFDVDAVDGWPTAAGVRAVVASRVVGGDDVLADLITLRADRAFAARLAMGGAAMRDGARTFVERAAVSVRLAAVTRARRDDADAMLRLAGISDLFTVLVTADDVFDAKPSPAPYALALDRLRRQRGAEVAPSAALAIEDGVAGCRAARAVSVRCVAVGPLPAHAALEADAYVDSLVGHTVRTLDELSRRRQERVQ